VWSLLTVACSIACADVANRAIVPVPEYTDYRAFRVANTAEHKLGAGYEYLKRHPDGTYRDEVRLWLGRASKAYVRSAWDDPRRLEAFLAEVPAGPVADRAVVRMVELTVHSEYQSERDRVLDERAERLVHRLADAEEGRRALVVGVAGWAKRLSAIRNWGARTSELDGDIIYHFRLTEPAARCTETECVKTVMVSYAVPEGKAQSDREAVYDVGMRLEDGGVRAVWITGPELFTRLGEAVNVAAVSSTDLVGRAEAIGQATQVIALAIEQAFPSARCTVEAVSPVVLHRRCDGAELRVVSAVELGDEDRIVVAPTAVTAPSAGTAPSATARAAPAPVPVTGPAVVPGPARPNPKP
jgi:hypothetical protein